jgi:hypothetical protein
MTRDRRCVGNTVTVAALVKSIERIKITRICDFNGVHLGCDPAHKYLGIWMDDWLSFKKNIDELVK